MKINGKQTLKLRSGSIKFKNYFQQLALLFNIYTDFESLLRGVRGSDWKDNTSYIEKYQKHIPCRFAYKVVRVDVRFNEPVALYRGKNAINNSCKAWISQKSDKKHFNNNLVMFAEDKEIFPTSNIYWIWDNSFDVGDNKRRDYCHVTGK